MSKDILVFLPSRDEPNKLDKTINMLFETSYDTVNYDLFCVVDEDQKSLYKKVMDKYKNVHFEILEHNAKNYSNIMSFHFDLINKTDYYFNWWVTDDFYGLKENWDQKIVDKKNIFFDGYYTLFTNNLMSRNINALSNNFTKAIEPFLGHKKPVMASPSEMIYQYHEMLPICTKNWRLSIKKIYDCLDGSDHVFLNAALAHLLSVKHGYSRSIEVDFYYEGIVDSGNAAKKVYSNGLTRDEYFRQWSEQENFSRLIPVVEEIANEIWQHYRDRMDKPRGIGKYAR
jgi:hypothetical protein